MPEMTAPRTDVRFDLRPSQVAHFAGRNPFKTAIGEFTYRRTYSRNDHGVQEDWQATVLRVVNGCFTLQKRHCLTHGIAWDEELAQARAAEMFERVFLFKWTPPGRGLWMMGTDAVLERHLGAALMNCCFATTGGDLAYSLAFAMDMLMLGVGVGFDVLAAGRSVYRPEGTELWYPIPDSREGWVQSVRLLARSYMAGGQPVHFDYSLIRPAGSPIRTFGGVASGPAPLELLHDSMRATFSLAAERGYLTATDVTDLMNFVGRCVISGNVRRSAMLSLGPPTEEFVNLKNPDVNGERLMSHGWVSNNSVAALRGDDYSSLVDLIRKNGEPGAIWLDNMREYGRMGDPPDFGDPRVAGVNPCAEQCLEAYEACNLVETFPFHADGRRDFMDTLRSAFLYGKTVTLMGNHWAESNAVMLRNRRIGIGQSGIQQFVAAHGLDEWCDWSDEGYSLVRHDLDAELSAWLRIPRSIRVTTVKPSGTVSILANATPGIHFPVADRYHIRRVRVAENSPLLPKVVEAGYPVERDVYDGSSFVVEFPVDAGADVRPESAVPMVEQLGMAAAAQRHWSDNAVSVTLKFHDGEADQIPWVLHHAERSLKCVSFLRQGGESYAQSPYEGISEAEYRERADNVLGVDWSDHESQAAGERYCEGDKCLIPGLAAAG